VQDANQDVGSPLGKLLLVLSFTTGLIDAVSVLGLGKVFTANMTGNVVFMGFAIAGAPGFFVGPYVAALASFLFGAFTAGQGGKRMAAGPIRKWLIGAAVFETLALWIAAIIAWRYDPATLTPTASLYAIIALTGIAMGFRNGTVRQLKVPDLTTTVLTLTLTGLASDSRFAGGKNPNWRRRIMAVLCILTGAAIGAVLVLHAGLSLPLFLTGGLVLVSTLVFATHPASGRVHTP
jgi:uncharacterized membrane protein YoaK (UPF0700 family)